MRDDSTVALNRKARHEFTIDETFEAGLVLTGTEIKSIRAGKANIANAYARIEKGEAWLIGADIAPFEQGNRYNHDPKRTRKLLLHRREIDELLGRAKAEGPDDRAAAALPQPRQGQDRARPGARQAAPRPAPRHRRPRREARHRPRARRRPARPLAASEFSAAGSGGSAAPRRPASIASGRPSSVTAPSATSTSIGGDRRGCGPATSRVSPRVPADGDELPTVASQLG